MKGYCVEENKKKLLVDSIITWCALNFCIEMNNCIESILITWNDNIRQKFSLFPSTSSKSYTGWENSFQLLVQFHELIHERIIIFSNSSVTWKHTLWLQIIDPWKSLSSSRKFHTIEWKLESSWWRRKLESWGMSQFMLDIRSTSLKDKCNWLKYSLLIFFPWIRERESIFSLFAHIIRIIGHQLGLICLRILFLLLFMKKIIKNLSWKLSGELKFSSTQC